MNTTTTVRQPSWTWVSHMHEGRALALSSLPEAPSDQPHSGRVLSSSRGSVSGLAVCALQLASPVSVVQHLMLVLVLLLTGSQSCCCSWVQGHPSAGGNSPGPTCWEDPWPHSRVSWNSGWEDPWTAQRRVVTEWTRLCHHYTWEYQFICWTQMKPQTAPPPFPHVFHWLQPSPWCFWKSLTNQIHGPFLSSWLSVTSQEQPKLFSASSIKKHLLAPVGSTLLGLFLLLGLTFFTSYFLFPCMETPDPLVHSIPSTHPVFTITGVWPDWASVLNSCLLFGQLHLNLLSAPPAHHAGKLLLQPSLKSASHFC